MKRVVTLGEPMVMFVADEIGPLEGVDHFTKYVAGAELNVALGLARLGYQVSYVTKLGHDPLGRYIHNVISDAHLDTEVISYDRGFATGFQLKSKVTQGDPEVVYFRRNSAAAHLSVADIDRIDLSGVGHVHITGIPLALSEETRAATFRLIERAREVGALLTFDPNLRPSLWPSEQVMVETVNEAASRCDIVLPGIGEGRTLTGFRDERDIAAFYRQLGAQSVIVKVGPKGAYVDTTAETFYVPGFHVETVVDTVGAGDGFAVGIISGLLEGLALRDAVVRGNAIGAMQVMVPGDNEGLPDQVRLAAFLAAKSAG